MAMTTQELYALSAYNKRDTAERKYLDKVARATRAVVDALLSGEFDPTKMRIGPIDELTRESAAVGKIAAIHLDHLASCGYDDESVLAVVHARTIADLLQAGQIAERVAEDRIRLASSLDQEDDHA